MMDGERQVDSLGRRIRELCERYFANLDGYIGRLVDLAGPQAHVIVASDHGFTGSREVVRINAYLEECGYLAWRSSGQTEPERRRDRSWFANLDWSRTTAYCRTPSSNGISIRVAQHVGDAGIAPAEYETFRDRLAADLEQLRDENGERIVTAIRKREEVFAGPAMRAAPDLLLTLRDFGFASIANATPVVERRPTLVGTHHPFGILLACGPGVARGATLERCNIADVAAIVLHSLALPVPEDFEGQVPDGLFTAAHLQAQPIAIGPATRGLEGPAGGSEDLPAADKAKLIRQLRMLGYME
jgi:predicted AlkP superfamily phosphohydrolase/phosphomutase